MISIIDPHIHFFDLKKGQYHWLTGTTPPPWPNLSLIKANHHKDKLNNPTFLVEAIVHIEAGFNNNHPYLELEWLEETVPPLQYGAIAYLDITLEPYLFSQQLKGLAKSQNLRGIRDITEGDDAKRLLHKHVYKNLVTLSQYHLHFEAQFELYQLNVAHQIAQYCSNLPELQIILNHAGLLQINKSYQTALLELSDCANIAIKFSGFEHVANPLEPAACLALLLSYFGEDRVMFASNYPVCLMSKNYEAVWLDYYALIERKSLWQKLSYHNAKRLYRLK
jgi:predicted TIM-barrel fold metal-dependent hydrolase